MKKLKKWRLEINLSQAKLAIKVNEWAENNNVSLHTTHATISRIENDKQKPSWAFMDAIRSISGGEVLPNDFFEKAA